MRVWSIPVADGVEMSHEELRNVPETATRAFAYVPEIDGNSTTVVISEKGDNAAQDAAYRFEHDFNEDNGFDYGSAEHQEERKALASYVDVDGINDEHRLTASDVL